jgi:hypothetical protein
MGDGVFFFFRQLRHAFARAVDKENGVVSKAAAPARRTKDEAPAVALGGDFVTVRKTAYNTADETGGPMFRIFEFFQ